MTTLRSALDQYVNMRQGFGYKFQKQARLLTNFVSFMEECGFRRCRQGKPR